MVNTQETDARDYTVYGLQAIRKGKYFLVTGIIKLLSFVLVSHVITQAFPFTQASAFKSSFFNVLRPSLLRALFVTSCL